MTKILIDRSTVEQALGLNSLLIESIDALRSALAEPVQEPVADEWAKLLHYPDCWDTAAYPTLHDAVHEALAWSGCSVCKLEQQAEPVQEPVACNPLCELCVKRGYDFCANVAKTTPIVICPPQRKPIDVDALGIPHGQQFQPAQQQEPVAWNWMQDGYPLGPAYYGKGPDDDIAQVAAKHGRTVRLLYANPLT